SALSISKIVAIVRPAKANVTPAAVEMILIGAFVRNGSKTIVPNGNSATLRTNSAQPPAARRHVGDRRFVAGAFGFGLPRLLGKRSPRSQSTCACLERQRLMVVYLPQAIRSR